MCTAALKEQMAQYTGGDTSKKDDNARPIRDAADIPLGDYGDAAETATILQRRERIKQAQEHPGSHKPTGVRTRKDLMDELT